MPRTPSRNSIREQSFSWLSVILTLAIGVGNLFRWGRSWMTGVSTHAPLPTMNPLSAIAFVLASLSLGTYLSSWRAKPSWASRSLAMLVAVIGLVPGTATAFCFLGLALLSLDLHPWRKQRVSDFLALLSLILGLVAVTSAVYGTEFVHGLTGLIPVALNVGWAFLLLSLGLLFARPQDGWAEIILRKDFGGRMARTFLPAFIVAPLILGWLQLRGVHFGWFAPGTGSSLASVAMTLLLTWIVGWNAKSLSQAHAALQKQKQVLDLVLERISDGVVVGDSAGRCVIANSAAHRMGGIAAEDAQSRGWGHRFGVFWPDRVTPSAPDRFPLLRAVHGEATDDIEFYLQEPGSSRGIYVSISGRPLKDERGQSQGGVIFMREIREHRSQDPD